MRTQLAWLGIVALLGALCGANSIPAAEALAVRALAAEPQMHTGVVVSAGGDVW